MPIQERNPRLIHTSTLTDEIHQIRRHLKRLGIALLVLSLWLGASLMLCSIHPELSTVHTHPLGTLSQWISSGLLEHLGLVSFSVCLLTARLGLMLFRLQIPIVASFDLVSYALINLVCTFPLAVFFKGCTLFGAPYGGAIGERFLSLFYVVSSPYLELSSTCALLCSVLFYLQLSSTYGAAKNMAGSVSGGKGGGGTDGRVALSNQHENIDIQEPSLRLTARPSVELLNARSVKSAPQEVLARLYGELSLEEEHDEGLSELDEPIEEQLFKLSADLPIEERERQPVSFLEPTYFSSPLYSGDPISIHTNGVTASVGLLSASTHEPSIYQEHTLRTGLVQSQHDAYFQSDESLNDSVKADFTSGLLQDPFHFSTSQVNQALITAQVSTESKIDAFSDLSHRKAFILRAFEQLGVESKSFQAEVGEVTSVFNVTLHRSLNQMRTSIEVLNDRLNQLVKKSYGRTEPALLVLPIMKSMSNTADLQVTWPHRMPQFTPNKRGIEENRARRRSGNPFMLYMGDLPNGCDVYLPFKDIPSLLVTGGAQTSPHLGMSLLVMSLIYQARENELRFIVADPSTQRRPDPNPFHAHPQLFAPVLYQNAQVIRSLSWLLSELNARSYLMKKGRLKQFDELNARSKTPIHRIVMVISELNQLNEEALMLLAQLIDRLERTTQDVGIHLLMNTRGTPQTQLTQRVMQSCVRRLSMAAKPSEAKSLGCPSAVHLIPQQQDMILDIGTGPVRVHGWFLSPKAYVTFLKMISESNTPNYICKDDEFDTLPVPAIHGRGRSASSGSASSERASSERAAQSIKA